MSVLIDFFVAVVSLGPLGVLLAALLIWGLVQIANSPNGPKLLKLLLRVLERPLRDLGRQPKKHCCSGKDTNSSRGRKKKT